MHYKDGTEAKVGDFVVFATKAYDPKIGKYVSGIGELSKIISGTETCDGQVNYVICAESFNGATSLGAYTAHVTLRDCDLAFRPSDHLLPVPNALRALKLALQNDLGFAWTWHCNVAMAMRDGVGHDVIGHQVANEAAASVMRHLFGVDTRKCSEYSSSHGVPGGVDVVRR